MTGARLFFRHLTEIFSGRAAASLNASIVVALCAGLLLPALSGGLLVTALRQEQQGQEIAKYAQDRVILLASSLAEPMWNLDRQGMRALAEAVMQDPQIVRIVVTEPESASPILSIEHPERRIGNASISRQPLKRQGTIIGSVEIEVDNGLQQSEVEHDRRLDYLLFGGQFLLALILILLAMHKRVLTPLTRLVAFSNQIAEGDLEHPIGWTQADEIGQLANQLDAMRCNLKTSFAEQEAIMDNVPVGVIFVRNRIIHLANRQVEHIFGYEHDELLGRSSRIFYLSDEQFSIVGSLAYGENTLKSGVFEIELQLARKDGSHFWARLRGSVFNSTDPQNGSIWVFEDITEQRRAEEEIERLAFYDALTGLPNRRLMLDRLGRALTNCARHQTQGALMITDLDNFKTLNDTLGHDVGDRLLKEAAARLENCVRKGDTVARMGGDEFLIILEDLDGNGAAAMQAESVARKIQDHLSRPYLLDCALPGEPIGTSVHRCTSSTGIALFFDTSLSGDELMKRADTAMYQAKAAGRNTLRFFDPEMQAAVSARAALEVDLRRAIDEEQFLLVFQPQVDAQGNVIGAEALLRWQHPKRGLVAPDDFVAVAEEAGLIIPIGQWVVESVCDCLARWAESPATAPLTLALNVSARQFHHAGFVNQVLAALDRSHAEPQRLKLELTESLLLGDVEDVVRTMNSLKNRGIGFALDDFGTGYSSLFYLKRLPLDQLKIDKSFVRDVLTDTNDATIARSIVALARSLGLSVIAEGVETEAQRDFLAENGCTTFQGYFFSPPLPPGEFARFVQQSQGIANRPETHR